MDCGGSVEIVAETPRVRLVRRGRWAYVQRVRASGVVCIVALTENRELLLVEQHRPPLDRIVVELPAGLIGDVEGASDESAESAARRELLEETGYTAERFEPLAEGASSAGLCDEMVAMFLARSVRKVAAGGGDDSEKITVHAVPVKDVESWLHARRSAGAAVDLRIFAALHFARLA